MHRVAPSHGPKIDRVDLLLVCALVVVAGSYALGYHLDWAGLGAPRAAEATPAPATAAPQPAAALRAMAPVWEPKLAASVWAPDSEQEAWDLMTEELGRLAARYPGRVAIYLKDLKTQRAWTYHEDDLFPSASLIKVPLMVCVFSKIREGQLSLNDPLALRRRNRVGGSGSLKWRPDGTRLAVRDLLGLMINESDNTATSMLLEAVGLGYVQRHFPQMGLLYTGIYEEGMSIKAGRVAHENYTTAREMNMLMERIYRGEMVDRPSSEFMLGILKHRKAVASRLAKGLPPGWEIAHKTGLLRRACHDSAIIFSPRGDYAMTVLTGQNDNYKLAKEFISRLGRVTFRHYGGSPRYYAKAFSKARTRLAL